MQQVFKFEGVATKVAAVAATPQFEEVSMANNRGRTATTPPVETPATPPVEEAPASKPGKTRWQFPAGFAARFETGQYTRVGDTTYAFYPVDPAATTAGKFTGLWVVVSHNHATGETTTHFEATKRPYTKAVALIKAAAAAVEAA